MAGASRKRTLQFEVVMDDTAVRQGAQRMGGSLQGLSRVAKAAIGGVMVKQVADFAAEMFNAGIALQARERQFATVFEGMTDELSAWADEQNEVFGLSESGMRGLIADTGDLFAALKLGRHESADTTKEILLLANALSEWKGGTVSVEDAINRIQRAMLGEREGLIALNVKVSEADVQARLAAKGMKGLTGEALMQAKALETLAIIQEQSTNALKAYEEGGDPAIRASKELAAGWQELKDSAAELALNLTPLVQFAADVTDGFSAAEQSMAIESVVRDMAAWREEIRGTAQEDTPLFRAAIAKVNAALQELNGSDYDQQLRSMGAAATKAAGDLDDAAAAVLGVVDATLEAASPALTLIGAQKDLAEANADYQAALGDTEASEEDREAAALKLVEAQGKVNAAEAKFAETAPDSVQAFKDLGREAGLYSTTLNQILESYGLFAAAGLPTPTLPFTVPPVRGTPGFGGETSGFNPTVRIDPGTVIIQIDGRKFAEATVHYTAAELDEHRRGVS
jgi:hypothetical protein